MTSRDDAFLFLFHLPTFPDTILLIDPCNIA